MNKFNKLYTDILTSLNESNKYDPPMSIDQIKSKNFEHLLDDPIHRWRAETGIELIHMEPSLEELERIYANWQLMNNCLKQKSDQKSKEIFGITNEEHYHILVNALQRYRRAGGLDYESIV